MDEAQQVGEETGGYAAERLESRYVRNLQRQTNDDGEDAVAERLEPTISPLTSLFPDFTDITLAAGAVKQAQVAAAAVSQARTGELSVRISEVMPV